MKLRLKNKRQWMGLVLALSCMAMTVVFPKTNVFQDMLTYAMFLVFVPVVFIKLILKEPLSDFGFGWGNFNAGIKWFSVWIFITMVVGFVVLELLRLNESLTVPIYIKQDFGVFSQYILVLGVYFLIFESFFRGFFLFLLKRFMNAYLGVMLQSIAFIVTVILKDSQAGDMGMLLFIPAYISLVSGIIAIRSRSVIYPFFFSYISAILVVASLVMFS